MKIDQLKIILKNEKTLVLCKRIAKLGEQIQTVLVSPRGDGICLPKQKLASKTSYLPK